MSPRVRTAYEHLRKTARNKHLVVLSTVAMNPPKSVKADIALFFITIIWSTTFAVVKQCLGQISPILFLVLRFWLAGLVMILFLPRVLRSISRETLRKGVFLAILLAGGFVFQTLGLRETTPSRCAFITSLSVLLVPLLGYLILHYRPRVQTLCGVVLATTGLALLTLNLRDFTLSRGDAFTLLAALVFALHILYLGRYASTSDPCQLVVLQLVGTALICSLALPVLESPFAHWNATLALYLLLTAVLATAFACYVQIRAQQFTTANRAALVFSLEPFFAALFSYLLLGEVLTGKEWIGGALVLAGIVTSELRREHSTACADGALPGLAKDFSARDQESLDRLVELEPVTK